MKEDEWEKRTKYLRKKTKQGIKWVLELLEQNGPMTVRQIHYLLLPRGGTERWHYQICREAEPSRAAKGKKAEDQMPTLWLHDTICPAAGLEREA